MITEGASNTLLIIGFLIITTCIVIVTYYCVKALKAIINLTESLAETSNNINEKLRLRFLTAIPAILVALVSKFIKRGR